MKYKNKLKGFTLLELLAVLVILAALSAIAVPMFNNIGKIATERADKSNEKTLLQAANRMLLEENITPGTDITEQLVEKGYINKLPQDPRKLKGNDYQVIISENSKPKVRSLFHNNLIAEKYGSPLYGDTDNWVNDADGTVVNDSTCPIGDGKVLMLDTETNPTGREYNRFISVELDGNEQLDKKFKIMWYEKGTDKYYREYLIHYTDSYFDYQSLAGWELLNSDWTYREEIINLPNPPEGKTRSYISLPRVILLESQTNSKVYFSPFVIYELD